MISRKKSNSILGFSQNTVRVGIDVNIQKIKIKANFRQASFMLKRIIFQN